MFKIAMRIFSLSIVLMALTFYIPVFASGEIDIGLSAINRPSAYTAGGRTFAELSNPANADGVIVQVELWADTTMTDTVVGTLYNTGGDNYKVRDSEYIGTVTSGAKRTFSDLTIDVVTGDFLGFYCVTGKMERTTGSGVGTAFKVGEYIDPGDEATYSIFANNEMSLYGIGDEVAGDPPGGVTSFTLELFEHEAGDYVTANWINSGDATGVQLVRDWSDYPSANSSFIIYTGSATSYTDNCGLPFFLSWYYSIYEYNDAGWSSGNYAMIGGGDLDIALTFPMGFYILALGCVLIIINFFLKNALIYLAMLACWFGVYVQPEFNDSWLQGVAIIIMIFSVIGFVFRLLSSQSEGRY